MADYTLNILVKGDGSGATQLADQVNAVGMSLDGVGKATLALAGGGLVALGAGLTSAVNAAGEFEAGMNNFASVAGSSLAAAGFSLDDVKAKALELGAVTQFSAAQAQDAMINLAKGGVPVADIMGQATDATLALAAAGGLELGPAADIVSKQLGVWGETGVTASQVADQLAQAANASTVDVDELAAGLANVAGTAKTAGVDFGDLTQTMALIAPGFSSAADAGTSLKTMIANMQPATAAAKDAMQQLGLYTEETGSVFYDANGSFIGMEKSAGLLQAAMSGLSEADKVMALNTIFGSDALRAASAVANAGAPGFNAMGDAMTAAGTAADQSAIKQQGFAFALDSMKGTIETIQIVIGSALLPVLTSMISTITEALNGVLTFAQGILSANDPLAALVTAINTLVPGFSSFVMWIQQAAASAQPLIDMLGANLMPILAALGTVLTGAVLVALGGIIAGFLAAAAPIAALVAGLALLYAAFNSNFLGIQTIVTTVLGVVLGIVQSVGAQIVSFWTAYGAQIMAAASAAWSGLQGLISSVLQGVLSVVVAIGGQIITFWQTNGASIMATVQTTWAQLGTIISGAIQIITAIITALSGVVSTVFSTIANFISANTASIQAVLTGAWQVIQGVITAAMGIISGVIKTVLSAIQGDWRGVWEGLKTIVTSAVSGIGSILQGLGNIVRGALGVLGGIIKDVASSMASQALSIGKSIIDGLIKGIQNGIGSVISAAKSMAESVYNAAMGALDSHSPSKLFAKVGDTIPAGMSVGISAGMPKVEKNLINGIAGLSESAAKALDTGAKAISAAASYSGPGGSGLSGFLAAFADMAIQFNDAAIALGGRILGTATRFAETIGKVAGSIGPAVEGLEALQTFVAPSRSAMLAFTAAMSDILTLFKEVAYALTDSAIKYAAKFAESAGKVLGVVEVGAKAIAALADLPTLAPGTTQAFANKVAWIVSRLAEVGAWMNGSALSNAATFAEGAGKVLAIVSTGVDAFTKLNTFVKPIDGIIQLFTNKVAWLVSRFAEVGAWMRGPALNAAVTFAEGSGKVLGILEAGVAGFAALNTYVKPIDGVIQAFTNKVAWLVSRFVEAGQWLRGPALAAAAAFADGAGKVVAIIKPAVEGFAALPQLVAPTDAAIQSFADAVRRLVSGLSAVAQTFTADAVQAAASFADAGGKVVGILKNGVDGLNALADLGPIADAQLVLFANGVDAMVSLMWMVAEDVGQDATDAAAAFAEGAGKVVSILKTGVDGLNAIASLGPIADSQLVLFANGIDAMVTLLWMVAVDVGKEATDAAAVFGEGAGKAVGFIGNAVGSFVKLAEFTGIGQAAIDAFGAGLRATLQALVAVAQSFAADAVAAAAVFGEGVGKAIAFIGNAVDGLMKLADFKAPADKAVSAFFLAIGDLMERMDSYSVYFNDRMYASTKAFADGVHGAVANLGSIADSLGKLVDFQAPTEKAVHAFFMAIADLMERLDSMSGIINTRMIDSALTFTGGIKTVIGQLQGALQSFATLGDAKVGGDVLKAFIASAQSLVQQMNAYLPPSAEIIGQNTVVGLINGIVSQRGALITAMVNTVMAAVIAARQTLGIASPSKVFEQIGQYAGAGLQGGMAAMQPAVAATSAGLGISAVNATTSALRPSGGGTTNNNQRNITVNVTVGKDAGSNPYATADAVVTEINRRLGMQGT